MNPDLLGFVVLNVLYLGHYLMPKKHVLTQGYKTAALESLASLLIKHI